METVEPRTEVRPPRGLPQDVRPGSTPTETYGADGATAAFDHPGPALVTATADVHVQEPADAACHRRASTSRDAS